MKRVGLISYFLCQLQKTMYIQFAQIYEVFTKLVFLKTLIWKLEAADCHGLLLRRLNSLHRSHPSPPSLLEMTREDAVPGPGRHDGCHVSFPRNRYPPLISDGPSPHPSPRTLSPQTGKTARPTVPQSSLRS